MVIQQVEDVALGLVDEHDLGGVDLPQLVGDVPLEATQRLRLPRWLIRDEMVAAQHLMNRRHRRRAHPNTAQLRSDPPSTPPRMRPTHPTDHLLELHIDLARRPLAGDATDPRAPRRPRTGVDTGNRSDARSHSGDTPRSPTRRSAPPLAALPAATRPCSPPSGPCPPPLATGELWPTRAVSHISPEHRHPCPRNVTDVSGTLRHP